ncbi:MAG: hypothetical protein AAGF28_07430 [Pseudomonadota bacterium]
MEKQEQRRNIAAYTEAMLSELRTLSSSNNCDFLSYLIEMAMIEASDIASGRKTPGRVETLVPDRSRNPSKLSAEQMASLFMSGDYDNPRERG